jgi:DNA segregation ATPase FtsK/SpoIIIE-like protein
MAHIPHGCDACSYDGRPWLSIGALQPLPGETTTVQEHRGHEPGRVYGIERQVPARPVSQLVAFCCPACHDLRVYDLGPDDCDWTEIYAVKAIGNRTKPPATDHSNSQPLERDPHQHQEKTMTTPPSPPGQVRPVDAGDDQERLVDAARVAIESGYASKDLLMRRLRIGAVVAARLLGLLQQAQVIAPGRGSGARAVLVPPAQKDAALAELITAAKYEITTTPAQIQEGQS